MSDIYNSALANLVGQQLAARGVVLSPEQLLDRLLDSEKLASHLQMLHPNDLAQLAAVGRATVPGWPA